MGTGILLRWFFAFALISATYNPTPWNFVHLALEKFEQDLPAIVLFGLLLFIGYALFFRATLRSIGGFGLFMILAVVAALMWVMVDRHIFELSNQDVKVWLGILAVSFVLGVGLSWGFVQRTFKEGYEVEDTDE